MSDLPPDPPRLRAILAHLDRQITDNDTIGIYLRLQRDAVQKALTEVEHPPQRQRQRGRVKVGGSLPDFALPPTRTGYVVQQKRTPHGPEPTFIHLADCTMIEGTPHRIRPDEARAALTDPNIESCQFCRPDTRLGLDLA
ncbi:DUF6233 domain-containing protein [Streptomyces glomeratus]|nr:DUF6233 domain-containing protein [Streptomyces glomeratus]MCF1511400.1 DUF6233 domain-containing protein [Streptomyces glomeratus]